MDINNNVVEVDVNNNDIYTDDLGLLALLL